MNITQRIQAFVNLGQFLQQFGPNGTRLEHHPLNEKFYDRFQITREQVSRENLWFTPEHLDAAILGISKFLTEETLREWMNRYTIVDESTGKRIAVIMAGNIPMVGFHDMLCVLMAGHSFIGKLSSKDNQLLDLIAQMLVELEPEFENLITFTDSRLSGASDFEAIIATGSNNSARYFEAYFGKYPNIIRRNRNSIAILTGEETDEELEALGRDIFLYFGLGCRNVSKLVVPKDYDFHKLFSSWKNFSEIINHNKYANNYDYNKSLFLMNQEEHLDNGFVLLKENKALASPIGVVYYEYYSDINNTLQQVEEDKDQIQCIVGNPHTIPVAVPFGKAQEPELWDYADNVDTMEFLTSFTQH